ncbi:hypothetical protein FM076_01640 [Streptomyces albus subsp. chlorinus]|nr:hypothetical protein [Streptomyces albus subsp. chlorinus]
MYGSPLLPAALPPWLRFFPLYLTVPAGVFAVVSGAFALRDARHTRAVPDAPHEPGTDRRRARTGIALGAVALAVPLVLLVWAGWALP